MVDKLSSASFKRLDIIGSLMLLISSILFVFGFEQAGIRFPWSNPAIIVSLVLGTSFLLCFSAYEWYLDRHASAKEPVLPMRLLRNHGFVGLAL
jgi:hypothetical protein